MSKHDPSAYAVLFVDAIGYIKTNVPPRLPPLKRPPPVKRPPPPAPVPPPVAPLVPAQFNSCCPLDKIKAEIVKKSREALNKMLKEPLVKYWEITLSRGAKVQRPQNFYREHGGYICCDKKTKEVTSKGPYPGTWKDGNGNLTETPWEGESKGTTANFWNEEKNKCDKGTDAVAFYHTHPPGANTLSGVPGDMGFSRAQQIAITLLAPGMDNIIVGMPGVEGIGGIPLPPEK